MPLETQLTITFAMKNRLFELFYIYGREFPRKKTPSQKGFITDFC